MNRIRQHSDRIIVTLAILLWTCLLFVPKAAGSAVVLLLAGSAILYRPVRNNRSLVAVITLSALYFALLLLQFSFVQDLQQQRFETEKKLACIALPVCFLLYHWTSDMVLSLLRRYNILVALAGLFCLLCASREFMIRGDSQVFFYHRFAAALDQHAVYLSLYITIAAASLVFLPVFTSRAITIACKLFFLLLILLLSSKLFLVLQLLLYIYDLFRHIGLARGRWWLILLPLPLVLLLARMPVAERFRDIQIARTSLVRNEQLSDSVYLDGLSFRLLQWKNGLEILQEHHALLSGVASGDANEYYRQKIRAKKWYTGPDGQSGFLHYNMHNQYLETWIRSGMAGLLLLGAILSLMFYQAWRVRSGFILVLLLLFAAFFCTESVLERQAGIIPFCFIIPLCMACCSPYPASDHLKTQAGV